MDLDKTIVYMNRLFAINLAIKATGESTKQLKRLLHAHVKNPNGVIQRITISHDALK